MVQIEQHVWGMTPEGEAIILYTMRNDKGAEVKISNFGAAIVSVTMPDREGRMADVVRWDTNTPKATSSTEPPRERAWDAAPTASPSGR